MGDSTRRLTFDEVHAIVVARSIPEPNSGCLLWDGLLVRQHPGHKGLYGSIRLNGRMVKTHRVAYQAVYGPIPEGMHVLHRCDVGLCCNPEHLFLGTNDDNHADKAAKDRGRKKLTHAKAKEIREMATSGMTHSRIAAAFAVHQCTITRIVNGRRRMSTFGVT